MNVNSINKKIITVTLLISELTPKKLECNNTIRFK